LHRRELVWQPWRAPLRRPDLFSFFEARPDLPRHAVEFALVAVLGFQAAKFAWAVITPAGPLGQTFALPPVTDSEIAVLTGSNPFAASATAADAGPVEGLRLTGLRADGKGGGAAFFTDASAQHRVYGVGEDVAPGMKLASIAPDHVVLKRGGAEMRIPLLPAAATATAIVPPYMMTAPKRAAPAASPSPAVINTDPQALLDQVGLRPRLVEGRVSGYTLLPRGDSPLMKAAGLEPGDVLVALNGSHLTPERYSELSQELNAAEVQLTVQRGAEMRTITLKTGK
jgi:general secretion pathway protein C